ncbi:hypothetical protein [Streptomyces sp. NPDC006645]|uniref:hypothetical protein n=1 Tax=unclassified Streptomyces TaxID=2593676 RepID=UPI0033B85F0E
MPSRGSGSSNHSDVSDASSYESAGGYYTDAQREGLAELRALFNSNERRGWRDHFRANPMDDEMEAALSNAQNTLQSFIATGREVQSTMASYDRHPDSQRRYDAYAAASEAHGQATDQWIRYGTHFHREVAVGLNFRDADEARMAQLPAVTAHANVAQTLGQLNYPEQQTGAQAPQQSNGANGNNGVRSNGNRDRSSGTRHNGSSHSGSSNSGSNRSSRRTH